MVVAGLTGGIASGKTMAANLFRELGAEVIDADEIARSVVEPGEDGLERVKACFGPDVLTADGQLDRERMASQVFSNHDRREKLNSILHPLIAAQIRSRLEDLRRAGFDGIVIVDVPLLFECGWREMFDCTIVVYCEPAVQRNRLMERSALDAAQADARIASQMPLCEKKNRADFVIDNQDTVQNLRPAVADLYARLLATE